MEKVIQKFKVGDTVRVTAEYCRDAIRDLPEHLKVSEVIEVSENNSCLLCKPPKFGDHWSYCSCPKVLTGYTIDLKNGKEINQDWLQLVDKELIKLQNFYSHFKNKTSYQILNIERNEDITKIKEAYKILIKEYHPDLFKKATHKEVANKIASLVNKAFASIKI